MKLTACNFRKQLKAQVATCAQGVNPRSTLLCELND